MIESPSRHETTSGLATCILILCKRKITQPFGSVLGVLILEDYTVIWTFSLEKRCLTYKISVSATLSELSAADLGPLPPPPPAYGRRPDGDGGGGEDQDQDPQSRRSNGSLFQRRPVHLRLGPQLPSGRGAATLAPRAVFPALFLRRSVHLRLDPQMPLGRGAATLAPRAALPALPRSRSWRSNDLGKGNNISGERS
jgi:hypothetical protein